MSLELLSSQASFGGTHSRFRHRAATLDCDMVFAVYLPPKPTADLPVLYWLSGLTCTDENFMQKAGAHRLAATLGLVLVAPDTSPRGVPGDPDNAWDFGLGAGFYVDATEAPWSAHYQMYSYVVHELPALVEANFPVSERRSISGHSMGGHGALIAALKNPGRYRSVSAFAPVCHPSGVPWGEKAFGRYLGAHRERWREWDSCELLDRATERLPLLVDQGDADSFLNTQLRPNLLAAACERTGHPLRLRRRPGYDHSYYFIASFIDDHLRFHAEALRTPDHGGGDGG